MQQDSVLPFEQKRRDEVVNMLLMGEEDAGVMALGGHKNVLEGKLLQVCVHREHIHAGCSLCVCVPQTVLSKDSYPRAQQIRAWLSWPRGLER